MFKLDIQSTFIKKIFGNHRAILRWFYFFLWHLNILNVSSQISINKMNIHKPKNTIVVCSNPYASTRNPEAVGPMNIPMQKEADHMAEKKSKFHIVKYLSNQ